MTLRSCGSERSERQGLVVKHEVAIHQESTATQLAPSNGHLPVSEIAVYMDRGPMSSDHLRTGVRHHFATGRYRR